MKTKTLFFSSLVAAAAMSTVPAWADTTGSADSIWINFVSGQGTGADGYTGTWNDTTGQSGTNVSLTYSDTDGTASGASLTYTSNITWSRSATDGVLKGYLDDGSPGVTINVSNISYLFYDVTVIASAEQSNGTYSAKTVNGLSYTSDGSGNGILGSGTWGDTDTETIGNDNSFTVSGLSGDLSLQGLVRSGSIRGGVAGLIITNATSADAAVDATISAGSEWTSDSLAGETWTNASSGTQRYANLTLSNSATLNVTGTDITTNAIVATAADGDAKTLTLSGNAVNLIGPGVVRTDSTTAKIDIKNTLNFSEGGMISGNVSTGEGGLLNVSGGVFRVSASEDSSLNVSVGEGVLLALSSGTVNITEDSNTISTANLSGGALSGGNITTANVTSGTVAISGSTIGTLNATGGNVNFSGEGTKTTITGNISVCAGSTVEQSAGTVSATRIVLNDSSAKTESFYKLTGGVLNISGDGKQTSDTTSNNAILIGHWNGGTSKLTVSGGVLNATSGFTTISWDGAGTLEVSGGEANLYGISLNKYRNKGASTFTLSGGRVNLGAGGLTYGNGSEAITSKTATLSGGTLGALDNWSSDVAISLGGNVTIDTTKMSANPTGKAKETSEGTSITLSGVISDVADQTGSLTKTGAGTLTLSSANTFSGGVTVSSGTLIVNNASALGTGNVTVADGAKLSSTVSGTSLAVGGGLTTGSGSILGMAAATTDTVGIAVTGTVSLNVGTIFDLSSLESGIKLVSGAEFSDAPTSDLGIANLYVNGALVNQRGKATFSVSDNVLSVESYTAGAVATLTWDSSVTGAWENAGTRTWTESTGLITDTKWFSQT